MTTSQPSLGVIIPTRNSAKLVPEHLASLRPWLDLAAEVVVVDSDSSDGTVALLREGLSGAKVRFLNHPPGLYQSWNFGIQQIQSKYIYLATVGDSITRAGLEHLLGVAERLQSDVVISKPRFIDSAGNPRLADRWPIAEMLDWLGLDQPRLLSLTEQFLFAVTLAWGAILGSSASDLFRADCLKQRPFPTDFGTSGDCGWGIQNMFDLRIAITPECCSNFRYHEKSYSLADYHVESKNLKFFRLAQAVVERERLRQPELARILRAVNWSELEPALHTSWTEQEKLEAFRRQKVLWMLRPAAWRARLTRDRARKQIRALTGLALGSVDRASDKVAQAFQPAVSPTFQSADRSERNGR